MFYFLSFKLQVAFPELTLCPSEPYREEQLKVHGIASRFQQIQCDYLLKGKSRSSLRRDFSRKKIQFHEQWVSNSSLPPAELFPSLVFTLKVSLKMFIFYIFHFLLHIPLTCLHPEGADQYGQC